MLSVVELLYRMSFPLQLSTSIVLSEEENFLNLKQEYGELIEGLEHVPENYQESNQAIEQLNYDHLDEQINEVDIWN